MSIEPTVAEHLRQRAADYLRRQPGLRMDPDVIHRAIHNAVTWTDGVLTVSPPTPKPALRPVR